jgi:hypothetical protein
MVQEANVNSIIGRPERPCSDCVPIAYLGLRVRPIPPMTVVWLPGRRAAEGRPQGRP